MKKKQVNKKRESHSKIEPKRKTRILYENKNLEEEKRKKNNKKAIKKLEERKKKELRKKLKEIEINQQREEKKQKQKIKRKLSSKEIQRIQQIKRNIRIFFIIALIITGIILFLLSPVFTIKNVQVEGNELISKEQIISMLKLGSDTNLFKESKYGISKKIKENAYIDTVNVSRKLPSTLVIKVKERKVKYQLEFGSSFAYIDEEGNILEISSKKAEGIKCISGFTTEEENIKDGKRINEKDLYRINVINLIINSATNYSIDNKFSSIDISDEKDYKIYCEVENKTIHFGNESNIDTKILYIKAILEKEKEYEGEIFVNMDLNKKNPYFKQKV